MLYSEHRADGSIYYVIGTSSEQQKQNIKVLSERIDELEKLTVKLLTAMYNISTLPVAPKVFEPWTEEELKDAVNGAITVNNRVIQSAKEVVQ